MRGSEQHQLPVTASLPHSPSILPPTVFLSLIILLITFPLLPALASRLSSQTAHQCSVSAEKCPQEKFMFRRQQCPGCYVGYLWANRGRCGLHGLSGLYRGWCCGATGGGQREATGGHRDQVTPTRHFSIHPIEQQRSQGRKELMCDIIKEPDTSLLTSEPGRASEKATNPNYDTKGHQSS